MTKVKRKTIPKYHHAISIVSVIPIRKKADDTSEITSQLLFGEVCYIISKKNKSWIKIRCEWDDYEGWIDPKQVLQIPESDFVSFQEESVYTLELAHSVTNGDIAHPIVMASTLVNYDGISFKINKEKFTYNGQFIDPKKIEVSPELIVKVAKKYLFAPYLWGGRSPFGIDCSGLTQCIFKLFGIRLPRDAYQQASHGELVDFVETSKVGDLAFFENKEGRIHHVGIILENNEILHASGYVRIDKIDHYGIYHHGKRSYTHKLRFVKRILQEK